MTDIQAGRDRLVDQTGPHEPREGDDVALESGRRSRLAIWITLLAGFAAFASLARVTTNLGVEAPVWDKQGREYVWRIWWRARHQIVDFGPSWSFTLIYILLVLAFIALSVAAIWVALVPDEQATSDAEASPLEVA